MDRLGTLGAALGALGVAAGAFGAHALRARLAPEMLQVFETGARYQLLHAVAIVAVALAGERAAPAVRRGAWAWAAGVALFSGSLYALALSGVRLWGAVTPLGGAALIAGWLLVAVGLGRGRPPASRP